MSQPVIQVKNLGKRYRIGLKKEAYKTIREEILDAVTAPIRNFQRLRKLTNFKDEKNGKVDDIIWALKDVSFDVKQGETVGIIGRNGSGKSTLLKILSRIIEPTEGIIEINGRIASLLEVGTGFHKELTGRENIYLSGSILGMRKREIDKKLDEIVAFSEIEKFIDTPVKHYSSGMYVRLAFAIAAHLDPEILLVDEVLAVGDVAFQKKCLGKMDEVTKGGRTVLFVSHDMSAVQTLCKRGLLLHGGLIKMSGNTPDIIASYLDTCYTVLSSPHLLKDNNEIKLIEATIMQDSVETTALNCHRPFTVKIEYEILKVIKNVRFFLLLRNGRGEVIFGTSDYDDSKNRSLDRSLGRFISTVTIPENLLKVGPIYGTIGADIARDRVVFTNENILKADILDSEETTASERHQRVGIIAPLLQWDTEHITQNIFSI